MEEFDYLLGMTRSKAETILKDYGYTLHVSSINGKPMIRTADYRLDRVNVDVVDDRIFSVRGIG